MKFESNKSKSCAINEIDYSQLFTKTGTFGIGFKCLSKRGVPLTESQIRGVKKGCRDQLYVNFPLYSRATTMAKKCIDKSVLHVQKYIYIYIFFVCLVFFFAK